MNHKRLAGQQSQCLSHCNFHSHFREWLGRLEPLRLWGPPESMKIMEGPRVLKCLPKTYLCEKKKKKREPADHGRHRFVGLKVDQI